MTYRQIFLWCHTGLWCVCMLLFGAGLSLRDGAWTGIVVAGSVSVMAIALEAWLWYLQQRRLEDPNAQRTLEHFAQQLQAKTWWADLIPTAVRLWLTADMALNARHFPEGSMVLRLAYFIACIGLSVVMAFLIENDIRTALTRFRPHR